MALIPESKEEKEQAQAARIARFTLSNKSPVHCVTHGYVGHRHALTPRLAACVLGSEA